MPIQGPDGVRQQLVGNSGLGARRGIESEQRGRSQRDQALSDEVCSAVAGGTSKDMGFGVEAKDLQYTLDSCDRLARTRSMTSYQLQDTSKRVKLTVQTTQTVMIQAELSQWMRRLAAEQGYS